MPLLCVPSIMIYDAVVLRCAAPDKDTDCNPIMMPANPSLAHWYLVSRDAPERVTT